jgi:Zn-dependent protease with chaperone function
LPSLAFASFSVLASLYALLFGVLVFVTQAYGTPDLAAPLMLGFIFLQFLLGPWLTDFSLRFLGSLQWRDLDQLPRHLAEFIQTTCDENRIPVPRIGVIQDLPPNAFTYGRTPSSARLVITQGIIDLLDEEETRAVVGHEIGHIVHWDFVFMTLAQAVPVLLYQIYRFAKKASRGKSGGKKGRGPAAMAAFIAYAAYFISEYIVLYLSRVREYWADRFGAKTCSNPNHLSTALVKIAYGLSQQPSKPDAHHRAVQAMGISDQDASRVLGLYAAQNVGGKMGNVAPELSKEVMQWDLWNPWATYYELHSTHPLTAKRIMALGVQAKTMGIEPYVSFDLRRPESYWDEFLVDILFQFLPALLPALVFLAYFIRGKVLPHSEIAAEVLWAMAAGILLKTRFSYPFSGLLDYTVSSLLKKVKVSSVRGIPVRLKGRILGRGIPGYVLSEDLVLRDETGVIFLDYQQPLAIFNFIFALASFDHYLDTDVEVVGWYRRGPMPFVEILRIGTAQHHSKSWVYRAKLFFCLVLFAAGAFCFTQHWPQ